jgi:hypothetical protein
MASAAGIAERIQPVAELLNFRISGAKMEKTNPEATTISIYSLCTQLPGAAGGRLGSRLRGKLFLFYQEG